MRIAGINNLSLVNGDGCRLVVFTQGCHHHCKNCQNPDTWNPKGGYEMPVESIANHIKLKFNQHPLDGITLSGGDPFYQQEECCRLLQMMPDVNVWIYTVFKYEEIKDTKLAHMCDVIRKGKQL